MSVETPAPIASAPSGGAGAPAGDDLKAYVARWWAGVRTGELRRIAR